jgi:hypothetical protein
MISSCFVGQVDPYKQEIGNAHHPFPISRSLEKGAGRAIAGGEGISNGQEEARPASLTRRNMNRDLTPSFVFWVNSSSVRPHPSSLIPHP